MAEIVMPAVGMAMTEGLLLRWLKNPGDPVVAGEPVAEVETDKATMEVESNASGRLGEHLFEAGTTVAVGAILVHVVETDVDIPRPPADAEACRDQHEGASPPGFGVAMTTEVAAPAGPPPEISVPADSGNGPPAVAIPDPTEYRHSAVLLKATETDGLQAIDITGLPAEHLVEWLESMILIREFEETCEPLALAGKIPGGMHSAAGQEAVAVGAIRALATTDIVTSSHRSHHHSLAKGLTPRSVMAELYGKATGCLGGRGGHMHLADFSIGLFGSNGIVGGGLGIAMGAALAAKMRGIDQVAMGFFGDGGANTGRVWECINLAAVWKLPLIIICENNLYAVETHLARSMAAETVAGRAAGFGLPAIQVDGQDVTAMYRATKEARERARRGEGPTFIEALTYRYRGHNTGDVGTYRTPAEVEIWQRTKDPVVRLARALQSAGIVEEGRLEQMVETARAAVKDATEFAEQSPWPDPATAADNVTGLDVRVRENI
jgi:TPP-dependent pyruvate/acetoin dehydrogenase alpha subunit